MSRNLILAQSKLTVFILVMVLILSVMPIQSFAASFPPTINVYYSTQPTNSLLVTVSADSRNRNDYINGIGLAKGNFTTSSFPAQSIVSFDNDEESSLSETFIITENGTYTAYASDSREAVFVFTVSHLGVADVNPPNINLQVYDNSNRTVKLSVQVSDQQSGVVLTKWAKGNHSASYFAANGTVLGTTDTYYWVGITSNGVYTVYCKDASGNEKVETITILKFHQYYYLSDGRLDYVEFPDGSIMEYNYDANGNLISKVKVVN